MIDWHFKKFHDLTTIELYEAMRLRQEVFIVEQDCVYLDADGDDIGAYHLLGFKNYELVAYMRVFPSGIKYSEVSIGRVVTSTKVRRQGFGAKLMHKGLELIKENFQDSSVRISAQEYLLEFYKGFDFKAVSEVYLEDDIPHIEMLRDRA